MFLPLSMSAMTYGYTEGYGLKVAWQTDDRVAITTGIMEYGYTQQLCFFASSTPAYTENIRQVYATGYKLKDATQYLSYFPYRWIANFDASAVPMSYTGQQQDNNNSTLHLAQYDYSAAVAAPANDACTFGYHHLSAFLRITFVVPDGTSAKETLTIEGKATPLPTSQSHNLKAQGTETEVTTTATGSLSITLGELTPGTRYTAFLAMPQADLSSENIGITLGTTALATIRGFKAKPGCLYNIDLAATAKDNTVSAAKGSKAFDASPLAAVERPSVYMPDIPMDKDFVLEVIPLKGDVNSDGIVDKQDAALVVQHYLGTLTDGTPFNNAAADYNNDGVISISDANAIVNTVNN